MSQRVEVCRNCISDFVEGGRIVNKEMNLGPGAVFEIGGENTAYAQYFTGECYLKMLTTTAWALAM